MVWEICLERPSASGPKSSILYKFLSGSTWPQDLRLLLVVEGCTHLTGVFILSNPNNALKKREILKTTLDLYSLMPQKFNFNTNLVSIVANLDPIPLGLFYEKKHDLVVFGTDGVHGLKGITEGWWGCNKGPLQSFSICTWLKCLGTIWKTNHPRNNEVLGGKNDAADGNSEQ